MTRAKRSYVPKVHGCFECSQRRIHCDRGQPSCTKCVAKQIHCSGIGTRYRFRVGVIATAETRGTRKPQSVSQRTPDADSRPAVTTGEDFRSIPMTPANALDPWERHCLVYFSERIAPQLMLIDDNYNGWRHLVLPVAHVDELIRAAVLSTSSFHWSANVNTQLANPEVTHHEVFRSLRRRQNLQALDLLGKQTLVLGLLLLLTAVMVGADLDFHTVFRLLEAALKAIGGEESLREGELGVFLVRQVRKFRGYAAPLLDQNLGIEILSQTASIRPSLSKGWECFRFHYDLYPSLSDPFSLIYDLHEQACQIYMTRASAGATGAALTHLVDKFKVTMEALPLGSPGEHTLVWATLLVGFEGRTQEHQQFFEARLIRHHRNSGFTNVITALRHLRTMWKASPAQDWTQLLPRFQIFIV